MTQTQQRDESQLVYLIGLLGGGLCLGFGLLSLYYSFGWDGGHLNQHIGEVGFTGLDNVWLMPAADYSIGMVVAGVIILVLLNAGAWKRTDGY